MQQRPRPHDPDRVPHYRAPRYYRAPRFVSLAQFDLPAETVWFAETVGGGPYDFDFRWPDVASNPRIENTSPRRLGVFLVERHQGRTNVVWCDGHVKSAGLDLLARTNAGGVMYHFTVQDDRNP